MDPVNFSVPDWKSHLISHQRIEPEYHQFNHSNVVYGDRKHNQYTTAFGFGVGAVATKFAFTYLFGLIYARKQFIHGYAYFNNSCYNWVGASKYLLAGYLIGEFFSIFAYGQPFLVEDLIRRKYRSLTNVYKMEWGTMNSHIIRRDALPPPRDLFIRYDD